MFDDNKEAKFYAERLDVWSKRSTKILNVSKKKVSSEEEKAYRKKSIKIFIKLIQLIKLDISSFRKEVNYGKNK